MVAKELILNLKHIMKHLSSLMLAMLILVSANTFAQTKVDRSKAPSAGPAPKIQIGKSQTFTLDNGLKVIVVEDHKLPVINYGIVFNNQPINERAAAGYIDMTGALLSKGTKNRTKDQINEEIEFLGANLSASGNGIFGSSLTKHSGKLMAITADMLLNPLFLEEELQTFFQVPFG